MADADICAACGEIIPEGIRVCPPCSKEVPEMGNSKNLITIARATPIPPPWVRTVRSNRYAI